MAVNKRLLQGPTGGGALTPSENFKVVLYTGNGGTQSITGVGFKPDFVWIKERSAAESHRLFDSTRGATKRLFSDNTNAQSTATDSLTSFDTDGFSLGSSAGINESGQTYVAWCWKAKGGTTSSNTDGTITSTVQANKAAGFSIVTYTGTGSAASAGHGLSGSPDLVIIKNREATTNWQTWYTGAGTVPASGINRLYLNTTDANDNSTTNVYYPDATKINFNSGDHFFNNTDDFVAYCFKSIDGFSKIGSYEGNGTTTGPMVETGFEPAFILIKDVDGSDNWALVDNKRATTNPRQTWLRPNLNNAEFTNTVDSINFYSNGFQVAGGTSVSNFLNESGNTFIYMAFAADPDTEAPTLASSFNIETYTGTGATRSISGLGFSPSFVWLKERGQAANHRFIDTIRGATKAISSSLTNAEFTDATGLTTFDTDGFTLGNNVDYNNNGGTFVAWTWKADDNEPTIFGTPEDADAVAIYKFEDNGDDVTGNYDGTETSVTYTASGKFNKGATFPSSNSKINLPTNFGAEGEFFSISLWFKTSSANGSYMFSKRTGNNTFHIRIDNSFSPSGKICVNNWQSTASASANAQSTNGGYADGNWHHFVFTYNGTKANRTVCYIDGVLDSGMTLDYNLGTQSITNGNNIGNFDGDGHQFSGTLDQIRVYDKTLDAASVTKLYNETTAQNSTLNIGTQGVGSAESIVSANANAGFSIVKYEGNGVAGTKIPHGLSAAPEMIIVKNLEAGENWAVYHSATGVSNVLFLNESNAPTSVTNKWAGTNSTVFGVNSAGDVNQSGVQLIAYCFHSVSGYSKFGSYSGNGSTQSITTGFQVDWLMLKGITTGSEWVMVDSRRGDFYLLADTNGAEAAYTAVDFLSTGFRLTSTGYNESGRDFIYWAVAKNVPSNTTLANSFKAITYNGNGGTQSITGTGFTPDLVWTKARTVAYDHGLYDSVRGGGSLIYPSLSQAASTVTNGIQSFDADGVTFGANNKSNASGSTYVAWCWKAGNTWQSNLDGTIPSITNANTANGFSIVKYTGNGANGTVGHGLSQAPEIVLVKRLNSTGNWSFNGSIGGLTYGTNKLLLNSGNALTSDTNEVTAATSTTFTAGTSGSVGASGGDYVAYCWHSVSGYSKFGSYSGNGSTGQTITTGFQPDFVMIKSSNNGSDWYMIDSVRPNNKFLVANGATTEYTASDTHTFVSTGFTLSGESYNNSGYDWIYMAFKMN